MQSRTLAVVVTLGVSVALYRPNRADAQAIGLSSRAAVQLDGAGATRLLVASGARPAVASERDRALRLGVISGTVLGAAGGGAMVHHICADNKPDFGVLCPIGVVTVFAGAGILGGILTGAVIAPTVHGPKWKNILKGMAVGTLMGGVMAKTGYAHGKQIAWALLGNAAQGAGTAGIIVNRAK